MIGEWLWGGEIGRLERWCVFLNVSILVVEFFFGKGNGKLCVGLCWLIFV